MFSPAQTQMAHALYILAGQGINSVHEQPLTTS